MRSDADTRHPTIRRAKTSITNADVDKAPPGGDVREVRDPQLIRPRRDKLAIDEIGQRARRRCAACVVVTHARPRTAPAQAHGAHQPPHRAAGHAIALAAAAASRLCAVRRPDGARSRRAESARASASSRRARADRRVGSVCWALRRKYVEGAIGTTAQIDSTP